MGVLFKFVHRLFKLHSIRAQLRFWTHTIVLILVALVIIPIAILEQKEIKDEKIHEIQQSFALQKVFIEEWISEKALDIRNLAYLESTRALNKEQMLNNINLFFSLHKEFQSVVYVNSIGDAELSSNRNAGVNLSDRDYFKMAKQGKDYISDVLISRYNGLPIIIFSSPVLDDNNQFQGLIFGSVTLETVEEMMSEIKLGAFGEIYLVTREGNRITKPLLYPEIEKNEDFFNSRVFQAAINDEKDLTIYKNYLGEDVVGTYQWTHDKKWLIIGEVDAEEIMLPFYRLYGFIVICIFLVLFISRLIMKNLSDLIVNPLEKLIHCAQIIKQGNYDYRIDQSFINTSASELKILFETYNQMSMKLKENMELLEQSAIKDQLTGIYNRRYLMQEGKKLLEACIRGNQPCSVLVIDIDNFKNVNDTFGHSVGDIVLKHIAEIISNNVRDSDIAVRYGGEEFIVLTTNSSAQDSAKLAERIRLSVLKQLFQDRQILLNCTVSIGVAEYSREYFYGTNALEDVIERADKAMYRAKQNGRNRVEIN